MTKNKKKKLKKKAKKQQELLEKQMQQLEEIDLEQQVKSIVTSNSKVKDIGSGCGQLERA